MVDFDCPLCDKPLRFSQEIITVGAQHIPIHMECYDPNDERIQEIGS
jgi:hypothetical protein